ncbi:MAG: GAF domain-containing sensor histidine kinase, partial [Anaerolineae bacterium]|nr:GAF domain-containing sensor histidine kinase [Anaerolineae bacterium]
EIETLRSAAGILGAAFARREAEEAERRQRLVAEALQDIALSLASTLSLDELLDRILANARRVAPSDRASLMLIEGDVARVVRVSRYEELGLNPGAQGVSLRISETPNLAYMMQTRQPMLIPDVRAFDGWVNIPETAWVRSYAGAPIESQGKVVGFINLDFGHPGAVPPDFLPTLQAFAAQVGAALTNAQLYRSLEASSARAKQLAIDLLHAQEIERQAVARQLQEQMGPALTTLRSDLELLQGHLPPDVAEDVRAQVVEARGLVEQAATRTRDLSLNLRPPLLDTLGLVPALREYLTQFAHRTRLQVEFITTDGAVKVPSEAALALYRIVQEATTNISRHAQAKRVQVSLQAGPQALALHIEDDGVGFDVQAVLAKGSTRRGTGLVGMRERAAALGGRFQVVSQPGRGTRLEVTVPLPAEAPAGPAEKTAA